MHSKTLKFLSLCLHWAINYSKTCALFKYMDQGLRSMENSTWNKWSHGDHKGSHAVDLDPSNVRNWMEALPSAMLRTLTHCRKTIFLRFPSSDTFAFEPISMAEARSSARIFVNLPNTFAFPRCPWIRCFKMCPSHRNNYERFVARSANWKKMKTWIETRKIEIVPFLTIISSLAKDFSCASEKDFDFKKIASGTRTRSLRLRRSTLYPLSHSDTCTTVLQIRRLRRRHSTAWTMPFGAIWGILNEIELGLWDPGAYPQNHPRPSWVCKFPQRKAQRPSRIGRQFQSGPEAFLEGRPIHSNVLPESKQLYFPTNSELCEGLQRFSYPCWVARQNQISTIGLLRKMHIGPWDFLLVYWTIVLLLDELLTHTHKVLFRKHESSRVIVQAVFGKNWNSSIEKESTSDTLKDGLRGSRMQIENGSRTAGLFNNLAKAEMANDEDRKSRFFESLNHSLSLWRQSSKKRKVL